MLSEWQEPIIQDGDKLFSARNHCFQAQDDADANQAVCLVTMCCEIDWNATGSTITASMVEVSILKSLQPSRMRRMPYSSKGALQVEFEQYSTFSNPQTGER